MKRIHWIALMTALLLATLQLQAAQLFREPASTLPQSKEMAMDCVELEQQIARLQPMTYSYKPDFYQNSYQGVAITAGTVYSPVYYLYHAYDFYLDYREKERILPAEDKIARLQRLKAEKACFVD